MWTRPVLCRLCECPASDGGVRVDQLDGEKLSEWWRCTIGEEFEPVETSGQGEVNIICQFCLWDARLEHEYSVDEGNCGLSAECDWWSGHDNNKFFTKFYHQDETIQRCRVDLGPEERKNQNEQLSSRPLDNNHTESASKKLQKCLICAIVLKPCSFLSHMKNCHAGQFVQCKIDGWCAQLFLTEQEKMEHVQKDHRNIKKCEFCHRMYDNFHSHMRKFHKNLFRCSYYLCKTYFRSEEEMQKHIALDHAAVPNAKKCIFCNFYYCKKIIWKHMRKMHKSQLASAFKCPHCRAPKYFLTQAKLKQHIDCWHKYLSECIYCNKKLVGKMSLHYHVNINHQDVKLMCTFRGCSQYFHSREECESHFDQSHRSEDESKIFKCSKCSFRTFLESSLKRHDVNVHGTKDLSCPKCGKCYSTSNGLRQHLQSHEPKLCQYCNTQIRSMNHHQKQTKCENCCLVLQCRQSAKMHKKICIDN